MVNVDLNKLRNILGQLPGTTTRYARTGLRPDAMAGLTVAVMGVPQAMAYALIAGLPPVYGLYTAIATCIVAAALGSSNHLVTGPTNALSMVTLSLTAHIPAKYGVGIVETILLLTFMTGVIQLAFGALRLGGIIRYVSNSVIVGFTAGAGILIAANQLKNILGVKLDGAHVERFHEVLLGTLAKTPDTNLHALILGLGTALVVIFLPRYFPRLPASLLGIVSMGALAYFLGWHDPALGEQKIAIVRDIEPISGSLDLWHLPQLVLHPNYELTRELGAGALALAILGLIEAASIARAVASSSGQRLDFTREFIGQGASNIFGSFLSCYPGSGSFTRTAVCFKSGGRTRMAAIFSAVWTALMVVLMAPLANYIPKASLAGLLIVIAYSMIDKRRLKLTWMSGANSRMVLFGTLASTLVLPLEYAIFVGIFLSIFILLRVIGKTDLTQLVSRPDSGFEEVPFNRAAPSAVVTINMEGDLYFAAVEDLDYELLRSLTPETRVVVLRMKRLRAVGSTAMAILEHFWEVLARRNIYLVICGIEDELKELMTNSGLRKRIGEPNIFYADNKLFQSTELALARAWSIVEMENRRQQSRTGTVDAKSIQRVTTGEVMSRRCIRFGNQHQLREAVWLMSELYKRTKSAAPQTLFLQDREGKLFGELSTSRILQAMIENVDPEAALAADDDQLGALLRESFTRRIADIARTELPRLTADTPLTESVRASLREDLHVMPVCDIEGRVIGLAEQRDLVTGLAKMLNVQPPEENG